MNLYALADMARRQEIERLKALPYRDYLKTDWWGWKRDKAIRRAHGDCELCQERAAKDVHHVTYERLGCERPDDLVALCRRCHEHVTENGLDRLTRRDLLAQFKDWR